MAVENSQQDVTVLLSSKGPTECLEEIISEGDASSAIPTDTPGPLQSSSESYDQARETLKGVSVDASGKVELQDWVELNVKLITSSRASVLPTRPENHTINEDERKEFTNHINDVIENDPDIGHLSHDRYVRVLNISITRKPLNAFQITENNNIVITSAKGIGCSAVNLSSSEVSLPRSTSNYPDLYRLSEEGETFDGFLRLTPDRILRRWFNYHLKAASWKRRVNKFGRDVCNGENYTILLNQLKPDECSRAPLQTRDLRQCAEQVLQNAAAIGCRNLFNTWPGLAPLDEQETKDYGAVEDFDAEGERGARIFTLWLNWLGVEPCVFNLFENLKDGLVILQALDKTFPGSVVWRRVSKPRGDVAAQEEIRITPNQTTLSRFKQAENTSYAVELGTQNGMHLVGIQGADIVDGTRTLVLGLVLNITKMLMGFSGSGYPIADQEMLKWANSTDPSLTTGIFILDTLDVLRSGIVDPALVIRVQVNGDYEERGQNGGSADLLAMSIARKMNALIFLVPEDIVDVRPRLILTFIGRLMSLAH
ncbi:Calponin homology domain containing protein [Tylopilus felleus]